LSDMAPSSLAGRSGYVVRRMSGAARPDRSACAAGNVGSGVGEAAVVPEVVAGS